MAGPDSAPRSELLTSIAGAVRARLGAAACSVALVDGSDLVFRAANGAGAQQVLGMRIPVGRGIAGWVVASGQTVAVGDTHSDARFDADTAGRTGYLPQRILATPVEGEDGPIGVLEVLDHVSDPDEMQVVAMAARQVALVLELAEASSRIDDVLADPALADLVGLVRRLGQASDTDRTLASRLLAAVLEHAR